MNLSEQRAVAPFHGFALRAIAVGVGVAVAAGCAFWLAGGSVHPALSATSRADPRLELLAGGGFALSLIATAFAWRRAFASLGAGLSRADSCARYAAGSLINTVSPARMGDAVRLGLFARALPAGGRALPAAGALAALALTRALINALVLVVGAAMGAVPLLPLLVVALVVSAGAAALLFSQRLRRGPVGRLTAAMRELLLQPRLAAGLAGWALVAVLARMIATVAIVSALGAPHPLATSIAVTAALDVAALLPLSPGGLGITSGAVSVVLVARGIGTGTAVGAGLLFHAVETLASLAFVAVAFALQTQERLVQRPTLRLAAIAVVVASIAGVASVALDIA
ncbi:MAG: lysylphosphatidylglycerol synthase domain-containing protein [Gaiellaceae bacterium]